MAALRSKFAELNQEVAELKNFRKSAFIASPPMPQGAPPMDPAMMQQGAPPMDPAMMQQGGMPMDPAMMDPAMMQQGAPPMDPAMMQQGGMPADPAAQAAPPIDPALIDQIVGLLEEMGQKIQQQGAMLEELKAAATGEMQDLGDQVAMLEKRLADVEASSAVKPEKSW